MDEGGNSSKHSHVPDLFQGMAAGHAYYFLEDVYPIMTGRRILKTPGIIKALFPEDVVVVPPQPANGWGAPGVVAEPELPHRD